MSIEKCEKVKKVPKSIYIPEEVLKIIENLIWGFIVGALAARKNRDPLAWGILGGFSWFIALMILAFLPKLPPEEEIKE